MFNKCHSLIEYKDTRATWSDNLRQGTLRRDIGLAPDITSQNGDLWRVQSEECSGQKDTMELEFFEDKQIGGVRYNLTHNFLSSDSEKNI